MESKFPDETLCMREVNLKLCILCMLEDMFPFGVAHLFTLRERDTLSRFPAIYYTGDNFWDLFAFPCTKVNSRRITPPANFVLEQTRFKRGQTILTELFLLKMCKIPLKLH